MWLIAYFLLKANFSHNLATNQSTNQPTRVRVVKILGWGWYWGLGELGLELKLWIVLAGIRIGKVWVGVGIRIGKSCVWGCQEF